MSNEKTQTPESATPNDEPQVSIALMLDPNGFKAASMTPAQPAESKAETKQPVSATPPHQEDDKKGEAKPEPEMVTMTKQELESLKYKHREDKRTLKKELDEVKAKLRELTGEAEDKKPELDPIKMAALQERIRLSKTLFTKVHGADLLQQLIFEEDSPWQQIEQQARDGDHEAIRLYERAVNAEDVYGEIKAILDERALFAKYGTTNLQDILIKREQELEQEITTRLEQKFGSSSRGHEPMPPTLGRVSGGNEDLRKTMQDEEREYSLSSLLGATGRR